MDYKDHLRQYFSSLTDDAFEEAAHGDLTPEARTVVEELRKMRQDEHALSFKRAEDISIENQRRVKAGEPLLDENGAVIHRTDPGLQSGISWCGWLIFVLLIFAVAFFKASPGSGMFIGVLSAGVFFIRQRLKNNHKDGIWSLVTLTAFVTLSAIVMLTISDDMSGRTARQVVTTTKFLFGFGLFAVWGWWATFRALRALPRLRKYWPRRIEISREV